MDVLVAYLLVLNLRDSAAEDNVCKRPFTTNIRPACPLGLSESVAKIRKKYETTKWKEEKNSKVLLFVKIFPNHLLVYCKWLIFCEIVI